MIALEPPFQAKDLDQLFKKVCKGNLKFVYYINYFLNINKKGKFPSIPPIYSKEL